MKYRIVPVYGNFPFEDDIVGYLVEERKKFLFFSYWKVVFESRFYDIVKNFVDMMK